MDNAPASRCIVCQVPSHLPAAEALARSLQLPLLTQKDNQYALQLCYLESHIELYSSLLDTGISVDFCAGKLAHRHHFGGGRGQAIAKAIGLKQGKTPTVLDATAGLAADAFTLATLGCSITLLERSAMLCALIADAIERAQNEPALQEIFQRGFQLINRDAIEYLQQLDHADLPEVIYLDPMYPERKKSAKVKKTMQILQQLHGADDNAEALLACSLAHATKRVVIKRPAHAASVKGRKPSLSIKSKKTRYDIYTLAKL